MKIHDDIEIHSNQCHSNSKKNGIPCELIVNLGRGYIITSLQFGIDTTTLHYLVAMNHVHFLQLSFSTNN